MRICSSLLILVCASACMAPPNRPEQGRYTQHVTWLSADAREGREAGTAGFDSAADYVAEQFANAGLIAAGDDGSYFQAFEAQGNRELIDGNQLEIAGQQLTLNSQWRPFSSAPSGSAEAPLAFLGYGLSDPGDESTGAGAWDDYAGIDVAGRLVVVLRHGPSAVEGVDGSERWTAGGGQRYATHSAKINQAYKRGAAGIVIVNDARTLVADGGTDEPVAYRGAGGGAVASIPAVSLTGAAGQSVFAALGLDLGAEQRALDEQRAPRSRLLPHGTLAVTVSAERIQVNTSNVVARLPGSDPELAREYVLVGAHLDHLGLGVRGGSMGGSDAAGQVHNGADDNASGVAGLLEIARALSDRPNKPRRSVVFVAFGAEEWGLLGSRHYVQHPTLPLADCVAMINMDMIGRSVEGRVEVGGVGTADVLPGLLDRALEELVTLREVRSASVTPNSDHQPFLEAKLPVISLFTGLHGEYHTPEDDVHTLDMAGATEIAALAAALALSIGNLDVRPAFTDPDSARIASTASVEPHEGQAVVGYGVSFGSRPDMTYVGDDGVKIAGTRPDSPAERAGLLPGDIIIALDGTPIRNLEDYSVLLFSHRPGDEIKVTVRRGDSEIELTARLEGRAGDT